MKWASGWSLLLSLLIAGPLACGGRPPTPDESSTPSAPRLILRATFDDGQPAVGATVVLNEQDVGQVDSAGQLSLDIPPGQYTVRLSLDAGDGHEVRTEQRIDVDESPQEVSLTLHRPPRLFEPLEVTNSRVHLAWSRSAEENFLEYRVYVSLSSLPDSSGTWGELVFVEADASRNHHVVESERFGGRPLVAGNKDLYFRLSVVKRDGSLTTSNMIHVKTPRWNSDTHFTRFYTMSVERQFTSPLPVQDIAYDGTGLWLLYNDNKSDYYAKARSTLVQRDPATWEILKTLSFEDYRPSVGLTWGGDSLWVSLSGITEGILTRIDPSTGARGENFAYPGIGSIAWSDGQILTPGANILGLDPLTGAPLSSRPNPFTQLYLGGGGGLAARPGELWLSDHYEDGLAIIDDAGEHIGVVEDSSHFERMTFMGDKLVVIKDSTQIVVMDIQDTSQQP